MRGEGRDRIEEQGRRWRGKERRARGEREKKAEIDGGREREDRERETERERERAERERVLSPFQRRLNGTLALVVVLWVVVASMAVARKAIAAAREALTVEL